MFEGLNNLRFLNLGSMEKELVRIVGRWDHMGISHGCHVMVKLDDGTTQLISYNATPINPRSFIQYSGMDDLDVDGIKPVLT